MSVRSGLAAAAMEGLRREGLGMGTLDVEGLGVEGLGIGGLGVRGLGVEGWAWKKRGSMTATVACPSRCRSTPQTPRGGCCDGAPF